MKQMIGIEKCSRFAFWTSRSHWGFQNMVRKGSCSKKLQKLSNQGKIGAIDIQNAPDLHSGRLGVIGDFKTWLENIPVAKLYKYMSNQIKIGAKDCHRKLLQICVLDPLGVIEDFKTW